MRCLAFFAGVVALSCFANIYADCLAEKKEQAIEQEIVFEKKEKEIDFEKSDKDGKSYVAAPARRSSSSSRRRSSRRRSAADQLQISKTALAIGCLVLATFVVNRMP